MSVLILVDSVRLLPVRMVVAGHPGVRRDHARVLRELTLRIGLTYIADQIHGRKLDGCGGRRRTDAPLGLSLIFLPTSLEDQNWV